VLPFGALACQQGIELLGRSGTDIDAALGEAFAHVGRLYGAIDLRVQARDDGFRRAGPQPRKALLDAHGVRELRLKGGPTRQISFVRRRPDAANRNISAVYSAVAAAYA